MIHGDSWTVPMGMVEIFLLINMTNEYLFN